MQVLQPWLRAYNNNNTILYSFKHVSMKRQSVTCRSLYNSNKNVIISLFTNSQPMVYEEMEFKRFVHKSAMYLNS